MCFGPDTEALWPSGRLLSALMCDIKLSVTSLHVSTVKFERYTCTVTDALATHMQTKIGSSLRRSFCTGKCSNQLKFPV